MKFVAAFFLSMVVYAQPLTITCGSPTDQYFSSGSVSWAMPAGAVPAFLRYGSSFSYDIPLANGFYTIALTLVEPNKTAAKQRLFSVTANGQTRAPLDVFALTGGANVALTLNMMALVGAGQLHLQFASMLSGQNAVVSQIQVMPVSAPPVPLFFHIEAIPLAGVALTATTVTYVTKFAPVGGVLTWWLSSSMFPNGQPSSGPSVVNGQQLTFVLPTGWSQTDNIEIVYQATQ